MNNNPVSVKHFALSILVMVAAHTAYSQTNSIGSTGPVGIGTSTPATYLHVYRNASGQYTPLVTLEDGLSNGYTQLALKGNARQYHIGVGNSGETSFGIANKFYIWDQNAVLPRMVVDASGNVGIGITSPANRLSVYGINANESGLNFARLNNTATAAASNGKVLSLDASGNVILVTDAVGSGGSGWALTGNAGTAPATNFIGTTDLQDMVVRTNNVERMRISSGGNVSIGTNDAKGYKFAVNGDAIFTKIKVKINSAWPDYVFERSYDLPLLSEVENYILQYKHLPGIKAAAQIEQEGVDVAAGQADLLKKIEELTLYVIEQNKQIQKQSAQLSKQQEEINKLQQGK
jgi:hypothetical protein